MLRSLNRVWSKRKSMFRRQGDAVTQARKPFRPALEALEGRVVPAFAIRATEFDSLKNVVASSTQTSPNGPGSAFNAIFTLPDFSITIVGNNSNIGSTYAAHSTTINMLYTGPTGANSDSILIEVLGDSYVTPSAGPAQITSNASPSTSGLQASTVTMTSGVLNGDVALSGTPGTTLNGQLGQTLGAGSVGTASSVLLPNPTVSGSVFTLANPFTFYQTYTFGGFNTTGLAGSMSAGSEVDAVPNANNPHIAIVKLTNGTNNDDPPTPGVPDGPIVMVGSTVTWTYNVTNPGNEPIANVNVTDNIAGVNPLPVLSGGFNVGDTNDNGLLDPGETWVYTATGIATLGQYSNVGTVTGTSTITNTPVASDNPDHYFGVPVTPTITTQQTPLMGPVGTSTNDTAIVTGYYPTGTVTFNLYDNPNGTGTSLFTDTEPLVITPEEPLVGAATSADFTITAPGTYYWVATYNGDNLNNNPVTSTTDGEPVVVATPAINIVKLTNGTNNDSPPVAGTPDGPIVPVGSTVTWTYNVTNPGTEPIANVAVSDNIAGVNPTPVLSGGFNVGDANDNGLLDPGETWEFTASGTATAGQYSNIGTVTGTSTITNTPVSATNPDHYYGYTTNINIVKLTNGTNNDNPPVAGVPDGPTVPVGSTVTWTYNVTTTGTVPLSSVAVSDNIAGVNPTPVLSGGFNVGDTNHDGLLEAGETWEFTASGIATAGQYSNIGTATGTPVTPTGGTIPGATPVSATNPDHYYGTLSLGDFVWNDVNANGIQDSSDLTSNGINGVLVDLENSGGTVIATTTTGNNPVGGAPGYYQFSGLLQGTYTVVIDSSNFTGTGALVGYTATPSMVAGSTTANDSNGSPASVTLTTANDETIDFGYFKPGINIVKLTNGTNNDSPPVAGTPDGPTVPVGSTVTWTYNVTNPTGVALSSVSVSDNIAGVNPTPVLSGGFNVGDTNHDGLLENGETWVFTASGTAIAGQYSNIGTATGTPVTPTGGTIPGATPVSATNPDHYYGTLSLGDFVWNDVNANGIQDSSDLTSNGINGVLVDLENSGGTVIATTTTGNNPVGGAPGYYQFSGLLQGSYTVVIDSSNFASGGALASYTATPSMVAGSTTANDSNGSPAAVTLTTANDETIDFGYFKPGINIVKLTNGTNNDSPPVAGTPDGPTVPVGSTVTWTYNVTNPTGVALSSVSVSDNIAGVNPTPVLSGGFNVGDTNHDGLLEMGETWVFTATGIAQAGQYSNIGTATGTPVTPTGGTIPGATPVSATNPDHYYGTLSVGDFVWNDVNANGIQDSSDLTSNGINGVLVDLKNSSGTVIATTTTGNNPVGGAPGYYQFSGLLQGTYTVVIDSSNFNTGGPLAGYTATPSMVAGSTPANDSNGSPASVTLSTANDETIDFGYHIAGTPNLGIVKTADQVTITGGQTAGYTVTITNTGTATDTNVTLTDPLPPGVGGDINWTIDTSGTGHGAGTNPADFHITGAVGSQSLSLSPAFISGGDSLAPGQSIAVHITSPTTVADSSGGGNGTTFSGASAILGAAVNYTVLYEGISGPNFQVSNSSVYGNIGIGGTGHAQLSGPGTIGGRIDFSAANTGQYSASNTSGITSVNYNVSAVSSALTTVNSLSSALGAVSGTSLTLNGNTTVNASAGHLATVNGTTFLVFNIASYSEGNGNVVTINGDGSGDPVVFNFTANSNIQLGGDVTLNGLSDDQVIWNFTSTGQNLQLNNNASSYPNAAFQGIILAPNDKIQLTNSNLMGRVFGGGNQDFQINSGNTVNGPPVSLVNTATVSATGVSPKQSTATIYITVGQEGRQTPPTATISGVKFLDLTGNGFSADDTPLGGVTIQLYEDMNGDGVLTAADGAPVATTTTGAHDGTFSFTVTPGTYFVKEVVPTGYIQTGGGPNGSAGATYYTVTFTGSGATTFTGNNFDDFQVPTCTPTNVSFCVTNNCYHTTVSDLRGNTQQGDTVTVTFTVTPGMNDTLTLVSYTAPGSSFDSTTAYQQQIFDEATGTFGPGTHSLTVLIPNCYYQIDFVCGQAINVLGPQNYGPDSANIFYTPQDRLLSADNGGTQACSTHTVCSGDYSKCSYWGTSTGQHVIDCFNGNSGSTCLAQWLATCFPNLYGSGTGSHCLVNSNGSYCSDSQVAYAYTHCFSGNDQQVLSAALSCYATSINLTCTNIHNVDYHFTTSLPGSGMDTYSVGNNGSAFGLANNTTTTVMQLLMNLNACTSAGASVSAGAGQCFSGINNTGNVTNAAPSTAGVSYTPAQVRAAYGVNNLALDGTGQTIAIVDAYDDPSILTALDTFDAQFSLTASGSTLYDQYGAAASFLTVVNQSGQTRSLPATDPTGGWEVEEALDVEWIHAMAPGAQIVLVEANSQSLADLMGSVATAASLPNVSVVSMSWGYTEGASVLAQDEAAYDADLTTPAGHQGVTFVASTGDYGTDDPEYPAFSPNVVAVGGTSLTLNSNNSYSSETGWGYNSSSAGTFIGGGGGVSQFEAEPAYQQSVQSTGYRTTPDVSFVADPGTGVWVADPYNLSADNPWEVVGGTSLSAPSWAGLFALANQGRAEAGQATLGTTTPNQAQQALYTLPLGDFNDVTTGTNGYNAGPGYDLVTGLGTPVAGQLVPDLVAFTTAGTSPRTVTVTASVGSGSLGDYSSINAMHNAINVFDAQVAGTTGLTFRDSLNQSALASTSPALDLSVLPKPVAAAPVSALTVAPTLAVSPLAITTANGNVTLLQLPVVVSQGITLPTAVASAHETGIQVVSQAPVSPISVGLVQAPQQVASQSAELFAELARGRANNVDALWQQDELIVPAADAREPLTTFGSEAPAEEQVLDSIFGSLATDNADEALVLAPGIREVDAACAVSLAWLALSASAEDERNSRKSSGLPQGRSPKV